MKPRTSSAVEIVVIGLLVVGIVALFCWVVWSMPGCSVDQRLGRIEAALQHVEHNTSTRVGGDQGITGEQVVKITAWGAATYIATKYLWIIGSWFKAHALRIAAHRRLKKEA